MGIFANRVSCAVSSQSQLLSRHRISTSLQQKPVTPPRNRWQKTQEPNLRFAVLTPNPISVSWLDTHGISGLIHGSLLARNPKAMSPRHQPPSAESFPEIDGNMLASKPAKLLLGDAQEEPSRIPALELPSLEERNSDENHFTFTHQLEHRNRSSCDLNPGPGKPIGLALPRPRSERSLRKRLRLTQRHDEPREEFSTSLEGDDHGSNDESEEGGSTESSRRPHCPTSMIFNSSTFGSLAATTTRSGSSSGSGSTVTPATYTRNGKGELLVGGKPNALSFLEPDSPAVTKETIQRTVAEAVANWREPEMPTSPQSAASSSSTSSTSPDSLRSDGGSEQDTEPSTSPEQSVNGDIVSTTFTQVAIAPPEYASPFHNPKMAAHIRAAPRRQQHASQLRAEAKAHRYGTPEMPRGRANLPHRPPNALTPRNPGHGHVKHLPRAEKLPLTGYELLAAQLSSRPDSRQSRNRRRSSAHYPSQADSQEYPSPSRPCLDESTADDPPLKPIYRRFEALNHRLLLHLQDELSELEEHLHRLDTADTQTRRLQNSILPASRRAEFMAGGELQWHKTDILGKIGFKLGQYSKSPPRIPGWGEVVTNRPGLDHVLSSFTATQSLPAPSTTDVQTYRAYLATRNPITEIETRFLDPAEDLVSLAPRKSAPPGPLMMASDTDSSADYYFPSPASEVLTPVPQKATHGHQHHQHHHHHHQHHQHRPANATFPAVTSSAPPNPALSTVAPSQSSSRSSARARKAADALSAAAQQDQVTGGGNPTPLRLLQIVAAAAVAVEIPVLASRAVHGFAACVAVALVAAAVGHVTSLGNGAFGARGWVICAGAYGVVMAFVLGWVG